MFRRYYKGILIPILLIVAIIFVSKVDGGAECGAYPITETANVKIVVTLENGHSYVVEESTKEIVINTYNCDDPAQWEIVKY